MVSPFAGRDRQTDRQTPDKCFTAFHCGRGQNRQTDKRHESDTLFVSVQSRVVHWGISDACALCMAAFRRNK